MVPVIRMAPALLRKVVAKKMIYEGIDFLTDEDDYVKKNVFGVKNLNGDEKSQEDSEMINRHSNSLLNVDVGVWTDDDFKAMKMSSDYMKNARKRQKVLEYLDYKQKYRR